MPLVDVQSHDPIPLELPFKGNRQYLHGTDIFNAVVALTQPSHGVSFRFHRVMHHPIDLVPIESISRIGSGTAGYYIQHGLEGKDNVWLFRDAPNRQVTRRIPYDENDVIGDAVHGADCIESPGPSNYSFIERAVALNKSMLQHRGQNAGPNMWLLARLDLVQVPLNPQLIELHVAGLLGTTMIKSKISCEGKAIGHIAFWSVRN